MIKLEVGKFYEFRKAKLIYLEEDKRTTMQEKKVYLFYNFDFSMLQQIGKDQLAALNEWQETENDRLWKFEQENPGLTIRPLSKREGDAIAYDAIIERSEPFKKLQASIEELKKEIEVLKITVSRINSAIGHYWL